MNVGGFLDVFTHVRQPLWRVSVVCLVGIGPALSACQQTEVQPPPSTSTPVSSTTFVVPSTTVQIQLERSGTVDLVRVDPATLKPASDSSVVTSGDWISGSMSENGEWLMLNVWIDTEPDTDLVQVVEVASGTVVTEYRGALLHSLKVGNDGSVFHQYDGATGGRLSRLKPGSGDFEEIFDAFPPGFTRWGSLTLLDDRRAGWFGELWDESGQPEAALLVADLSEGSAETYALSGVTMGQVGEEPLGDWMAPELVEPSVVWDIDGQRALVVHADEPRVTVVDLAGGGIIEHTWSSSSWADAFLAWLIPPARAKGPSFGTRRDAVLSPSGVLLYVALEESEVAADGSPSVHTFPGGVEVVNTGTWSLVTRFDIPASRVALSPDGAHLVAAGVVAIDTPSSTASELEDVHIIDTETMDVIGTVDIRSDWFPDIQFSADSRYAYLGESGGGRVHIIQLKTAELLGVVGSGRTTMFGPAAMLSTASAP
jgi:hypothetical protein